MSATCGRPGCIPPCSCWATIDGSAIVFLDIDGVLRRQTARPGVAGATANAWSDFIPECVEELDRICLYAGAEIVVTSFWKRANSTARLAEILRTAGVLARVVGQTPDLPGEVERYGSMRGYEIAVWLAEAALRGARVRSFVQIDNGPHTSGLPWLAERLVQPASAEGLTAEQADRAIAIFRGQR